MLKKNTLRTLNKPYLFGGVEMIETLQSISIQIIAIILLEEKLHKEDKEIPSCGCLAQIVKRMWQYCIVPLIVILSLLTIGDFYSLITSFIQSCI